MSAAAPIETTAQPWPPDYTSVLISRQGHFVKVKDSPDLAFGAKEYYRTRPLEFIEDWCVTYDPRNAVKKLPTTMPFVLFERQRQFILFLYDLLIDEENGLTEKCRDMGATWECCAFSVWMWIFIDGSAVGWGSRKEALVDKLADPDSIFEKMRIIIDNLPRFFWPRGFDLDKHASFMRIVNTETGSTITGEAGDNIGRGGRKTFYFKDESDYYEHPEKIEAALSENTNIQLDISSVNGPGTIFDRRCRAGEIWEQGKSIAPGVVRVFIFDWWHHPAKTQEWYDKKRDKADSEGLSHIFAQEVDRDRTAAIDGIVIPAKWVKACINAHVKLEFDDEGEIMSSLDVADEGADLNAYACRKGVVLRRVKAWPEGDTGETAGKAIAYMQEDKSLTVQYDCIGVGAGVKAEYNRRVREEEEKEDEDKLLKHFSFVPWNAGNPPLFKKQRIIPGDKDTPRNQDMFKNFKAQAWWNLRRRCEKTYEAVVKGVAHPFEELVSFPTDMEGLHSLVQELSQATFSRNGAGQIIVDKTPQGTTSPNRADVVVMNYWPIQKRTVFIGSGD